jgi:hypothetical protein
MLLNSSKAGTKGAIGELPKAIIRSLPETGYFCQNLSQADRIRQNYSLIIFNVGLL